jgi:DNA replication protein DnaC
MTDDWSDREQQKQFFFNRRLIKARIPDRLIGCTLNSFETPTAAHREAHGALIRFLEHWDGQQGLILGGRTGVGKTHLGVALLIEMIRKDRDGLYWNVPHELASIKRAWDHRRRGEHDDRDAEDALESALEAPVLLLDDLGAETPSDWANEQIYDLVNTRWERLAPTIITSNLVWPAEYQARWGSGSARIYSRLSEMCQVLTLSKIRQDWRLRERGAA